jgi:hypothetical protein
MVAALKRIPYVIDNIEFNLNLVHKTLLAPEEVDDTVAAASVTHQDGGGADHGCSRTTADY